MIDRVLKICELFKMLATNRSHPVSLPLNSIIRSRERGETLQKVDHLLQTSLLAVLARPFKKIKKIHTKSCKRMLREVRRGKPLESWKLARIRSLLLLIRWDIVRTLESPRRPCFQHSKIKTSLWGIGQIRLRRGADNLLSCRWDLKPQSDSLSKWLQKTSSWSIHWTRIRRSIRFKVPPIVIARSMTHNREISTDNWR